jgi:arylsulfatase A-like enzyme
MAARPHMLILMTDQQRADCLHCAGNSQLQTPNLDRLAREGTRCAQATTVAPLCMPARISLATALYPHNHGMWANYGEMPASDDTLFRLLQHSGYLTALVGKAHYYVHSAGTDLRQREDFMHARGFEYVHETTGPSASANTASYVTQEWEHKGLWERVKQDHAERLALGGEVVRASPLPVEDFLDSYIGRKAVEFVDVYADHRPMCLFVGFGGPHPPMDAPGSYATMYRPQDTPAPIPIPAKHATRPDWLSKKYPSQIARPAVFELIAPIRANYYGKISLIDYRIGCILEAFRSRGWLDDLCVFFLSDHGEMLGDHGRFGKASFHESSIRIPLIARWPGRIVANAVTDALVESIDIFPTLLEAAGCAPPPQCLGRSLWPVLRQPTACLRESQLCEIGRGEKQIMLRTRRHKLAVDSERRAYMLYDVESDPQEQDNLAGDPAARGLEDELRRQMQGRLERSRYVP